MRFWSFVHKYFGDTLAMMPFEWCCTFHNWTGRKLEEATCQRRTERLSLGS